MAPEAITHDRIYNAVKHDLLTGVFLPGARVDLRAIAERHRASTTPVREAIHRLIGERLFEPHPDTGFRIVLVDALHLAHLYAWYGQQILSAVHTLRSPALGRTLEAIRQLDAPTDTMRKVERTDRIFRDIVKATGNLELMAQVSAANERLRYYRIAETVVFPNYARELETLIRNGHRAASSNIRRRIAAYHERRIQHAGAIAENVATPRLQAQQLNPRRFAFGQVDTEF